MQFDYLQHRAFVDCRLLDSTQSHNIDMPLMRASTDCP